MVKKNKEINKYFDKKLKRRQICRLSSPFLTMEPILIFSVRFNNWNTNINLF